MITSTKIDKQKNDVMTQTTPHAFSTVLLMRDSTIYKRDSTIVSTC